MTEPVDILAVAAHPDDAEIGCGATLALAAAVGARVVIADATLGEAATHGTPEERDKERILAAERLGIAGRRLLGMADTRVGRDPADRDVLVALLRECRPRIVLAPHVEDRHPDHAAIGRLAREASFLASVGGDARRPRVYHYMIHHPFAPSFVVDTSAAWERKLEALSCYESQLAPAGPATELAHPSFLESLAARDVYHGSLIGAARGEAFWSPGPVPLAWLPDLPDADGYRAF